MNRLLLLTFFLLLGRAYAQETERIEIARYQMVGWFVGEPKLEDVYVIQNGKLYEKKRKRLELVGPCDTLAALMDRKTVDALFRSDEKQCEDGYEVNIRFTYYTVEQNVPTTYSYEFSTQTHCEKAETAAYLHRIMDAFYSCRNGN